jgi:hypothetical protein
VRSAVATIGLIAAVPITTGLAAAIVRRASAGSDREAEHAPAHVDVPPAQRPAPADPWMAFVERDPRD